MKKMKIYFFGIILSVFFVGCLMLPAPHIYNYAPLKYETKSRYTCSNSNVPYPYLPYFYLNTIDNDTKMFSSLEIISLSKLTTIRLRARIDIKDEQLQFDSVVLQTSKMQFKMKSTILHKDSVFREEYSLQTKASEKQIGVKDSISVKIFVKNEVYNEKYYFDGK